jgi:hypothetical protein
LPAPSLIGVKHRGGLGIKPAGNRTKIELAEQAALGLALDPLKHLRSTASATRPRRRHHSR